MKKIRVKVTEEDIQSGSLGDPFFCPVARAITRTLATPVWVTGYGWNKTLTTAAQRPLSSRVRRWITQFDNGNTMGPINFNIELPD